MASRAAGSASESRRARPATVGSSKRSISGRFRPRTAFTREITWKPRSEWPPSSKKLSWTPTAPTPKTSLQIAASFPSSSVRGRTNSTSSGEGVGVAWKEPRICSSSAAVSGRRAESRAFGSATIPSSSVRQCPRRRSAVAGSKRSASYSRLAASPAGPGATESVRSNLAVPVSTLSTRASAPPQGPHRERLLEQEEDLEKRARRRGAARSAAPRPAARRGGPGAPRRPGTPRAPAPAARGRAGRRHTSARSTRVLTKKPISPSISARPRLATGEPTGDRRLRR